MIDPTPWADRSHPGPRAVPLELTPAQRAQFEAALRPATAEKRTVLRAQAVLLMAAGVATSTVSMLVGVHVRTVAKWRVRFSGADPIESLADAPRSGRPVSLFPTQTARESKPKRAESRAT
jgi:transposase